MSTTAAPTDTPASADFQTDQLTAIVASFSCLVFLVVIVALLSLLYRKDPVCCELRTYEGSHGDLEAPPQYYSSRQTLVGSPCTEQNQDLSHDTPNAQRLNPQSGQLFLIGLPASYRLPSLDAAFPRLPSYESVRKKDRQRQIHMMIADRFGLNGPIIPEPPPSYEESIRQSIEVPCDILRSAGSPAPPTVTEDAAETMEPAHLSGSVHGVSVDQL
ncbi:uncharacterized protein LOC114794610 [Denticeps clupeoides]|uniref:uncharacterized protein LOC114794610 n=1 Tax=Denticeps clupeoides TaxID=299321 RepID=UPI0010A52319|nr:uncharacterized protein LOC114794610 [Denticeps clupeoides]